MLTREVLLMATRHPFEALGPEAVLDTVEALAGVRSDGRLLPLNSYENRVYMVGVESGPALIGKFYRPDRWSDAQIREEHAFAEELAAAEIPVVAPLRLDGDTLRYSQGFRVAIYPMRGGRMLEADDRDVLRRLGMYIGRIHAVGAARTFRHRADLDPGDHGRSARDHVLASGWLPPHLEEAYKTLTDDLLEAMAACWERAGAITPIRLHGDFHPGNVLQTPDGFHVVDLDDTALGPAIQDLWMLLPGERAEREVYLAAILEGYRTFCDLDPRELHLIEPLRTLRLMRHAAWLAERWDDPAFPQGFPWFGESRYWEEHLLALREQMAALAEPPLSVP